MKQLSLLVLGVYPKSEGYPNTVFRLEFLSRTSAFKFLEIHEPIALNAYHVNKGRVRKLRNSLILAWAHFAVFFRYLLYWSKHSQADIAYLPYPSIISATMLGILPKRMKPKIIVSDAFISLYDTAVNDRSLLTSKSVLGKLLWKIERMAYDAVDTVIVDTPQNAIFMSELFCLPKEKFIPIPLATNEAHSVRVHPEEELDRAVCHVLFIGTMVPLQGIATILDAIKILEHRNDIQFELIGDGQQGTLIQSLELSHLPKNMAWKRSWHTSEQICEAIAQADICLGIFGTSNKAHRVCPYKIYDYARMGKCIITAETEWSRFASETCGYSPFALVPPGDAVTLAKRIEQLANDSSARARFASASKRYYNDRLSNRISEKQLTDLLLNPAAQ